MNLLKTLVLTMILVVGVNFIATSGHEQSHMIPTIGSGCLGAYVFLARLWSR